jgi:hypothetical protein
MDSTQRNARARWRGIAGALAAVIVVGALAALLVRNASQRGTGANPNATSTSTIPGTPAPNATPTAPGAPGSFPQPGQLPVVAPSDPQIVFRAVNNAPQRSTDGGKTYQALPIPHSDLAPIDDAWITVSPLDASRVFLTLLGLKNGNGCENTSPPPFSAFNSGDGPVVAAALSGFADCAEQFFSANSGQAWSRMNLPGGNVLGATTLFRLAQGPYEATAYVFQTQGTRLYAGAGFSAQGGAILQSYGARLMTSDDGGATWSLIDQSISNHGLIVCDFAAAPDGATIYAAVTNQSCANEGMPAMWLYRSDNGGQTWVKASTLPSPAEGGMVVAPSGALYIFEPAAQSASHTYSLTQTAHYALVSLNQGVSFTSAPTVGIDPKATLTGPVAVLSDGSAVFVAPDGIYAWKTGANAWKKISQLPRGGSWASLFVTPAPGGGDTLTMTDTSGAITTVHVQE